MAINPSLISFKNSEDWELVVNIRHVAEIGNRGSYSPLSALNLEIGSEIDYVAIIVTSQSSKANWDFAGNILQIYSFPFESDSVTVEKVESDLVNLSLNRLKVISTNSISTEDFQLRYEPPTWFKDFVIRVFKYTG